MTITDWRETESRNPQFDGLEDWPTPDILAVLADGQAAAVQAVRGAIGPLTLAVEAAADRLKSAQGRLVYSGAGTSGRLAMLDGIELTPTFGWPQSRCVFLFAGGMGGLQKAVEGAEDDTDAAIKDVSSVHISPQDVVIGLAASGTTPYTRQILKSANTAGALTIGMANNPDAPLLSDAQIGILLKSGAEVLAGSTRLAAGTAQKAALNLFSTALMAKLNKIHSGYMVDVLATNDKLVERAIRMVMDITGCEEQAARKALNSCENHVKSAVLIVEGCPPPQVQALLDTHDGHLSRALRALEGPI